MADSATSVSALPDVTCTALVSSKLGNIGDDFDTLLLLRSEETLHSAAVVPLPASPCWSFSSSTQVFSFLKDDVGGSLLCNLSEIFVPPSERLMMEYIKLRGADDAGGEDTDKRLVCELQSTPVLALAPADV